jgi:predicted nucleic acid-binding protein
MTVILDTNVVLDVLLKRIPHFEKSSLVLLLSEKKLIDGFVSASAITDIFFLTNATYHDKKMSMDLLKNLLKTVSIASVTGEEIHRAVALNWSDFEDAVQYSAGEKIQADYIITRDSKGYIDSAITTITPADFLSIIGQDTQNE